MHFEICLILYSILKIMPGTVFCQKLYGDIYCQRRDYINQEREKKNTNVIIQCSLPFLCMQSKSTLRRDSLCIVRTSLARIRIRPSILVPLHFNISLLPKSAEEAAETTIKLMNGSNSR